MEEVVSSFKEKASSISPGIRTVAIDKNTRDEVEITSTKVDAALAKITKPKNIKMFCDNLQSHFSSLSPWLSLCSSPKAFRTAWGLRSKVLSPQDAEAIINDGGQLVPVNLKSRILKYEEQGVLLSDKKLLLGPRLVAIAYTFLYQKSNVMHLIVIALLILSWNKYLINLF